MSKDRDELKNLLDIKNNELKDMFDSNDHELYENAKKTWIHLDSEMGKLDDIYEINVLDKRRLDMEEQLMKARESDAQRTVRRITVKLNANNARLNQKLTQRNIARAELGKQCEHALFCYENSRVLIEDFNEKCRQLKSEIYELQEKYNKSLYGHQ